MEEEQKHINNEDEVILEADLLDNKKPLENNSLSNESEAVSDLAEEIHLKDNNNLSKKKSLKDKVKSLKDNVNSNNRSLSKDKNLKGDTYESKNTKKRIFNNKIIEHLHNSLAFCIILSFLLNFAIETISWHSFIASFKYLINSPMTFLYNTMIIFATLSVAFLVKRRFFVYTVVSTIWLGLAITNGVILGFRTTPFTVTDLSLIDAGLSIITNYMSIGKIILIIVSVIVVLIIFVLIFLFAPKHEEKISYKKSIAGLMLFVLIFLGTTNIAINRNWVAIYFGNLNYAYRDYGFPYCFINTWLNTGISMPGNYTVSSIIDIFSPEEQAKIAEEVAIVNEGATVNNQAPNILMLQMESFFDPTLMKGLSYSEDPIPHFRELKEKYSTGFLTVPSIGAGTANTEFEMLTGMRVRFFGPGEYPYKSVLKDKTCESLSFELKQLGFKTHAIHNHRGVFYGRNNVFSNLGFDTFTSLEYMNNVTKTPKNWARDMVLTSQILDALDSTEGKDFVYTISVQGHGQYPTKAYTEVPGITVEGTVDLGQKIAFEYYLEQIHEMDEFLKSLTEELSDYDEKVVLVLFGDHLPSLNISDDDLVNGNVYETEYVIWSNYPMKKQDKNVYSYQLGAEVFGRLGIDQGVLTKYHQNHQEDQTYLENLKAIQFDMLYGAQKVYGPQGSPYKATKLKMGVNDIVIDEIMEIAGKYYILGKNFTPFSKISMDGEVLDTIFLSPTTLSLLEEADPEDVERMKVSQVEKNKEILSTTE